MELNRFKELLESTMGNVKPLISEQLTGDTQVSGSTTTPTKEYKIESASFDPTVAKGLYVKMYPDFRSYKFSYNSACTTGKKIKDPRGGKIAPVYHSNEELPEGCVVTVHTNDGILDCDKTGCKPSQRQPNMKSSGSNKPIY